MRARRITANVQSAANLVIAPTVKSTEDCRIEASKKAVDQILLLYSYDEELVVHKGSEGEAVS